MTAPKVRKPRGKKSAGVSAPLTYEDIPAERWSNLKYLRISPRHYLDRLSRPVVDTPAMAVGRGAHCATLEPEKYFRDFAVWRGATRRGEEWERFKLENPGKTILTEAEHDKCQAIAKAIRSHRTAAAWLERGEPEKVVTWTDPDTGIACKGKLDFHAAGGAVVDIKTTTDLDPRRFAALAFRYGYVHQGAFYRWGLDCFYNETCTAPVQIIAVESEPPFDVAPFTLSELDLARALEEVRGLLCTLKVCRDSNEWPGRFPVGEELLMPGYAWESNDDAPANLGITINPFNPGEVPS